MRRAAGPRRPSSSEARDAISAAAPAIRVAIGVYELLQITPEIKRLVVGWATQDELRRLAERQGMRSLRQEAIELVAHDVTTIAEVIRSIYALVRSYR